MVVVVAAAADDDAALHLQLCQVMEAQPPAARCRALLDGHCQLYALELEAPASNGEGKAAKQKEVSM